MTELLNKILYVNKIYYIGHIAIKVLIEVLINITNDIEKVYDLKYSLHNKFIIA